ncbi:MAG: hypothetical protein EOO08_13150 [Chitinophagaceae bacterium]|nr:MAG: hypothetical protein EOO08_13150 [Chitinophagaceae bacterium]
MGTITTMRLSDNDAQKDKFATHVDVLAKIRAYAIGVQQTSIASYKNPPPTWFDTLSGNLNSAKGHASVWNTTLEPGITATIPQSVIELGNRFKVGTNAMLAILASCGNQPSPDQVKQISGDLGWIVKHVEEQRASIASLQLQFQTFQNSAAADFNSLTTGNDSIQQAILDDNKRIIQLQGDIAVQNAEIAKDNAAITASGIAGGVGLFVGVGVMGLGAAAAGPLAPIAIGIGAFIMVGSIVEMATVIAIYAKKLADAQSKLAQDNADLANEQKEVAALTIMNNSITNLVGLNKDMAQSLTDVANWFSAISAKIVTVKRDIDEAGDDMKKSDWDSFVMDIQTSQLDWADFVNFATQMQKVVTTIQNQVIDVRQKEAVAA